MAGGLRAGLSTLILKFSLYNFSLTGIYQNTSRGDLLIRFEAGVHG